MLLPLVLFVVHFFVLHFCGPYLPQHHLAHDGMCLGVGRASGQAGGQAGAVSGRRGGFPGQRVPVIPSHVALCVLQSASAPTRVPDVQQAQRGHNEEPLGQQVQLLGPSKPSGCWGWCWCSCCLALLLCLLLCHAAQPWVAGQHQAPQALQQLDGLPFR